MPDRPLALTLLSLWSLVAGALLAALPTAMTDYATSGQVALAITALGGVIAVVHVVVAVGLARTSAWARPLGVLAYALAVLVAIAVATTVDAWSLAAPVLAGNALAIVVLARHTHGFHDGDRRPDDVSAHVGR